MELLGSMPDTLKFVIVFVLILGILVPLVWRWFNVGPLRHTDFRGRLQRLSVVEMTPVDVRHRLILVKRDNVEHLLLVGGPSAVVVESNIARTAARDPRPIPDARPEVSRQLATETPDWSLPPEPVARPVQMVDLDAALPEPPARTAREAMADSMRAVRSGAAGRRTSPVDLEPDDEEIAATALTPAEALHRAAQPQRPQSAAPDPVPSNDGHAEPKLERTAPPALRQPAPAAAPAAPPPARPVPAAAPPPPSDEGNFAEMAQRLEAALRRPAKAESAAPARQPLRQEPPAARRQAAPPDAASRARVKSADAPPDLRVLPGKGQNELAMENLEDEMAKMLGRPGKA